MVMTDMIMTMTLVEMVESYGNKGDANIGINNHKSYGNNSDTNNSGCCNNDDDGSDVTTTTMVGAVTTTMAGEVVTITMAIVVMRAGVVAKHYRRME